MILPRNREFQVGLVVPATPNGQADDDSVIVCCGKHMLSLMRMYLPMIFPYQERRNCLEYPMS